MSNLLSPFVLLITSGLLVAGCAVDAPAEAATSTDSREMIRRVVVHEGIEREYFVHVPPGARRPMPVVMAIHGYTSTATGFQVAHNLNPQADRHGYIVVYPQGSHFMVEGTSSTSYRVTSWNDLAANLPSETDGPHCTEDADQYPCPPDCGACDRCGWTSCHDDVGFLARVLDEVATEFPTDSRRNYLLGVSNGGMMALRLACTMPDRFAAVAAIIAQLAPGYACGPAVDVPLLHLYGGRDNTVRADGQPGADGFIYTTAEQTAKAWSSALSCATGPTPWETEQSRAMGLTCTAFSDCAQAQHEVVSCMEPDGGHDWPGQRVTTIPATCVTPEQYASMPGQEHCPPSSGADLREGMDLVWSFLHRYESAR